ncbi:MAG: alkaline phosphatase [Haloarculaceae archaeon]
MQEGERGQRRRTVLQTIGGAAGGGLATALADRTLARPVSATSESADVTVTGGDPDRVFPQGIASGGPTQSGVLLWTRVAPDVCTDDEPLCVQVASDPDFRDVVAGATVPPERLTDAHDHTVTVDFDGELDSHSRYHYRFVYDGTASETGKCRTLPGADDDVESVRFAVVSCQDYRLGYYGAYRHVAEADVDFLLHLGDLIYEYGGEEELADRAVELPSRWGSLFDVAWNLEDYRHLYRTYYGDEYFQRALAEHTLIACWDDHEIANNRWWDYEAGGPMAEHPLGSNPEYMRSLTADGIQAWTEYVPARVEYDPDADSLHEQFRLARTLSFGDLVDLVITDERLFRTEQNRYGQPDPSRPQTMLGVAELGETDYDQREWFLSQITDSEATWTAWANEVLFASLGAEVPALEQLNYDGWGGYDAERRLIARRVRDADLRNFVTLGGDIHATSVGYVQTSYGDPDEDDGGANERAIEQIDERDDGAPAPDPDRAVGVEFVTTAVSSETAAQEFDVERFTDADRPLGRAIECVNDHLAYFNATDCGYAVAEFTPEACTYRTYAVDKYADPATVGARELAAYRTPNGEVSLEEL